MPQATSCHRFGLVSMPCRRIPTRPHLNLRPTGWRTPQLGRPRHRLERTRTDFHQDRWSNARSANRSAGRTVIAPSTFGPDGISGIPSPTAGCPGPHRHPEENAEELFVAVSAIDVEESATAAGGGCRPQRSHTEWWPDPAQHCSEWPGRRACGDHPPAAGGRCRPHARTLNGGRTPLHNAASDATSWFEVRSSCCPSLHFAAGAGQR